MREEDLTPEERARHMRNLARNMAEGGARRRRKRTTAADDQKSDPFVKVPLRWATQSCTRDAITRNDGLDLAAVPRLGQRSTNSATGECKIKAVGR